MIIHHPPVLVTVRDDSWVISRSSRYIDTVAGDPTRMERFKDTLVIPPPDELSFEGDGSSNALLMCWHRGMDMVELAIHAHSLDSVHAMAREFRQMRGTDGQFSETAKREVDCPLWSRSDNTEGLEALRRLLGALR